MSNQIKLTIDVSDELLDKLLTVVALTQTAPAPTLGGMPMQLMALAQGQGKGKPPPKEDKTPIGFGRGDK